MLLYPPVSLFFFFLFIDGRTADGDNPDDVEWCTRVAQERAAEYKIEGVTQKLTLGVIKHVIPAIASTNSIIAAMCVNEALKLATGDPQINNYTTYSGIEVFPALCFYLSLTLFFIF